MVQRRFAGFGTVAVPVLLGLRWQFSQWGENKKTMKIDEDTNTMIYLGKKVVQAQAKAEGQHVRWLDPERAGWGALLNSTEIKELTDKINKKLKDSMDAQPKGKGKGGLAYHGHRPE